MRAYREDQKSVKLRISILTWGVVLAFFFLAGAFWYVQGVQAERYRNLSQANALREIPIPHKRGLILDRNGQILVDNLPAYQLMLMRSNLRTILKTDPAHEQRMIRFVSDTLAIPEQELQARITKGEKVPFNQPLPIAEDLTPEQVARFESHRLSFPAMYVETVQQRNYRYGVFASHVLGYLGEANDEEMKVDPSLKLGDLIGKKGVELIYDKYLRGQDGARFMVVDSQGRMLHELPDAKREPVPGRDIRLTLDFALQRKAEEYFHSREMVGAAVALDPRSGEVLAMVSSPAYDPNVYSRRFTPDVWKTIISNPFRLEWNRAIQGLYSPGSVFKVVMGMAGFAYGVVTPSTTEYCGGSAVFFGRRFRCWKPEGHGAVNFERAIKVSCDIYFYNLGAKLGVDRIAEYSNRLSLGEITKIDLQDEKPGLVPSEKWAREVQDRKWYPSETISVSIGQGPLLVTVLQISNVMAAIGTGGTVYRPHVLKGVDARDARGRATELTVKPEVLHEMKLDADAVAAVRQGTWAVVNEPGGTGSNARVPGLDVSGKTGTVQVVAQSGWKQRLPFKFKDHAWFASFAPRDNPELVVVVFIEHGGGGGAEAAPLAQQMFETYFRNRIPGERLDLSDPETLRQLREGELPRPGERAPQPPVR